MPGKKSELGRAFALASMAVLVSGCLATAARQREPGAGIPVDTGPDWRSAYVDCVDNFDVNTCRVMGACGPSLTKAECGKRIAENLRTR